MLALTVITIPVREVSGVDYTVLVGIRISLRLVRNLVLRCCKELVLRCCKEGKSSPGPTAGVGP